SLSQDTDRSGKIYTLSNLASIHAGRASMSNGWRPTMNDVTSGLFDTTATSSSFEFRIGPPDAPPRMVFFVSTATIFDSGKVSAIPASHDPSASRTDTGNGLYG